MIMIIASSELHVRICMTVVHVFMFMNVFIAVVEQHTCVCACVCVSHLMMNIKTMTVVWNGSQAALETHLTRTFLFRHVFLRSSCVFYFKVTAGLSSGLQDPPPCRCMFLAAVHFMTSVNTLFASAADALRSNHHISLETIQKTALNIRKSYT